MRNAFLAMLFGVVIIIAGGCKSEDSSTNTNDFTQSMSATIDGVDWSATSSFAVLQSSAGLGNVINIVGQNSSLGDISLAVTEPKVGEFKIEAASRTTAAISGSGGNFAALFANNSGHKVIFTKFSDTEIEGTFSFICKSDLTAATSKKVTNGKFHLKVTK